LKNNNTNMAMNTQLGWFLLFLFVFAVCVYIFFRAVPEPADVLYTNGKVYTMDANKSVAEAFATRGGRVLAIGTQDEMKARVRAKATVDLGGKVVFPGFIDAHAHLMSLGVSKLTIDLAGVASESGIAALVDQRVKKSEPGQWVRGRGWDQNLWPSRRFPSHEIVDRISPNNPVYLVRVDGHASFVNKKVLELAGISRQTADPPGGKIVRDAYGNPTGVFVDNAMDLVGKFLPPPTVKESEEAIGLAVKECLRPGAY
jgi:predicted amidohydrolase YtcJ